MCFNIYKCKVMDVKRSNKVYGTVLMDWFLWKLKLKKNLAMTISDDLTVSHQCISAYYSEAPSSK